MSSHNRLVVLLALAAVHAAGADSPPVVTELGLLPGDVAIGPASANQTSCSAARGDGAILVAWMDDRSQLVGGGTAQSGLDVFAIRLAADGTPLDPAPFAVAAGAGWQQAPQVSWNGTSWLVTFYSQDPTQFYYQNNVRGVRIAPDGTVIDSTPLLLAANQQWSWTGGQAGQWLVTWTEPHADGYGTYLAGRRLGDNGAWLDPAPLMLMDWSSLSGGNNVLPIGAEYLVVGADWFSYGWKARRIGLDGVPIGSEFAPKSADIGSDGSNLLIAWITGNYQLRCSPMAADGTLTNPSGALLAASQFVPQEITISHDGANWFVGWHTNQLRVARVAPGGSVLDPGGVLLPSGTPATQNTYGLQVVGASEGGALATYFDYRVSGDANVYGIPLSAGNVPGVETVLSTSTTSQRGPSLAAGPGGQAALVYLSEATADDRVLLQFLDASGAPTGAEPIEVGSGASLAKPGVAWNGEVYMVVWNDGSVKARRLKPDGSFIDPAPIAVMPGFNVDVAALGENFCVVASNFVIPPNPQFIAVYARRVSGVTGALLDPAPLAIGGSYSYNVRVHAAGGRWIATWEAHPTHDDVQSAVKYAFIDADGTHTPEATVLFSSGGQPDVAFDGSRHLFVWRNNSLANANNFIAGRLMNPDGSFVGAAFTIAEAPGRQLRPVVDWDGGNFVVAWDDQRNQSTFFDERTDIYAARVSSGGTVLDPTGIPVVVDPNAAAVAAVLSRADGTSLVASARFALGEGFDSYRIGVSRLGTPAVLGDLDGDGGVGPADLGLLLAAWGTPDADLNEDGLTNGVDLGLLLSAWTA